jgi:hypothetical protein
MTTTSLREAREASHAHQSAIYQAETIEAAYLATEWLRQTDYNRDGNDLNREAQALLRELGWDGTQDPEEVCEQIEERMQEEPLSVELGGWWTPGEEPEAQEFRILLSTGGPACRLVGTLGHGARLEAQDWFTPWEPVAVTDTQADALDWFANLLVGGFE